MAEMTMEEYLRGDWREWEERQRRRAAKFQPLKCRGCVWGRWDGSGQFCMLPTCQKPPPILEGGEGDGTGED